MTREVTVQIRANAVGRYADKVTTVTPTTLAGLAPAAAPAAIAPLSWLEISLAVLTAARRPLRAREILAAAAELGLEPASRTRTPTQSINRDLHAALRRCDRRLQPGPLPGQFTAARANTEPAVAETKHALETRATHTPAPRLPIEPLAHLIDSRGGLSACGIRPDDPDDPDEVRRIDAFTRGYRRFRQRGWLTIFDADELCVRALGQHPFQVYGQGWWDAIEADPQLPTAGHADRASTETRPIAV